MTAAEITAKRGCGRDLRTWGTEVPTCGQTWNGGQLLCSDCRARSWAQCESRFRGNRCQRRMGHDCLHIDCGNPGAKPVFWSDDDDTTLVKSTRPATCAVCQSEVTASIVLPDDRAVCEPCTCVALRNMIDDAAACRAVRT